MPVTWKTEWPGYRRRLDFGRRQQAIETSRFMLNSFHAARDGSYSSDSFSATILLCTAAIPDLKLSNY
jgi:hypothetical protein